MLSLILREKITSKPHFHVKNGKILEFAFQIQILQEHEPVDAEHGKARDRSNSHKATTEKRRDHSSEERAGARQTAICCKEDGRHSHRAEHRVRHVSEERAPEHAFELLAQQNERHRA